MKCFLRGMLIGVAAGAIAVFALPARKRRKIMRSARDLCDRAEDLCHRGLVRERRLWRN